MPLLLKSSATAATKSWLFNVIKVHIVDGVKTIKGEYNLYDTNKLRETFRVSDEITINVIN
jgi:hypothetical protein